MQESGAGKCQEPPRASTFPSCCKLTSSCEFEDKNAGHEFKRLLIVIQIRSNEELRAALEESPDDEDFRNALEENADVLESQNARIRDIDTVIERVGGGREPDGGSKQADDDDGAALDADGGLTL